MFIRIYKIIRENRLGKSKNVYLLSTNYRVPMSLWQYKQTQRNFDGCCYNLICKSMIASDKRAHKQVNNEQYKLGKSTSRLYTESKVDNWLTNWIWSPTSSLSLSNGKRSVEFDVSVTGWVSHWFDLQCIVPSLQLISIHLIWWSTCRKSV